MRVAVIETLENTRLGLLQRALNEVGASLDWIRVWRGDAMPSSIDAHDVLVVPGGRPSAVEDAAYPYLPELVALMRGFSDAGKPVMGICLGAQLLARAYGAESHIGTALEFSWTELEVTPDGLADPVLVEVAPCFSAFQWHRDTFTVPKDAVHLVSSATVANQCFRIGRAAYGMQFHFEASSEVVAGWARDYPDSIERMAPGWAAVQYAIEAGRHAAAADASGLAISRAFVNQVCSRS